MADINPNEPVIKTDYEEAYTVMIVDQPIIIGSDGNEHAQERAKREEILRKEHYIFEEDPNDLIAQNYDEDSDHSTNDSKEIYVNEEKSKIEQDFFETLGRIPDIDEISLDLSEYEFKPSKQEDEPDEEDVGEFVDPLTGERIADPTQAQQREEDAKMPLEAEAVVEDVDVVDEDEDEDDDLLLPPEFEVDTEFEQQLPEDDEFAAFLKGEEKKLVTVDTAYTFEAMERERAFLKLTESTNDFLQDLIRRVVDKCEIINPEVILQQNLSKPLLMKKLDEQLQLLDEESNVCLFLNRKTVEYFRRKKVFRPILDDNPDTILYDEDKLISATKFLDKMLNQLAEITATTEAKRQDLQYVLNEAQEMADTEDRDYEELVIKTLTKRDSSDKLKNVLENILKSMNRARDEISKTRMVLIGKQHNLASLVEKSDILENIGNGFSMKDFTHLQTQTTSLGKKMEERNVELNKLRTRFKFELHIMAHIEETKQMLTNTYEIHAEALRQLIAEQKEEREKFCLLKLEREKVRKEIARLSFQGGLLDKPDLMLDFDHTVDKLKTLRESVNQKKLKVIELQRKIAEAEEKLIN